LGDRHHDFRIVIRWATCSRNWDIPLVFTGDPDTMPVS
jgi:hypothetical protein